MIDKDDRQEMIDIGSKIISLNEDLIIGDEGVRMLSVKIVDELMEYLNIRVRREYEDDPLREDPRAGVPDMTEESKESWKDKELYDEVFHLIYLRMSND